MPKEKLLTLSLAGGVVAISTSAVLIRLAEAPPLVIAFYRMFFSALFFLPLALKEGRRQGLAKGQFSLAVGAGLMLALHFALWMTSLEHTSVASSVVLVTTQPLWVFLFSVLFMAEKPTPRMWFGLGVALAGSILVTFSQGAGGQSRLYGNVLAVGGAIMMAGYFLLGRRLRKDLPLAVYSFLVYGSAALVLLVLSLAWQLPLVGFTPFTWVMFLALALIPTVLGHNTLNWALKYLPATMVSVSILGEPLGASILAVFVLKEVPSLLEGVGSLITLLGIYLVWQGNARREEARH